RTSDLEGLVSTVDDGDPAAVRLDEGRIVGEVAPNPGGVGGFEHRATETLRRLYGSQLRPIERRDDGAVLIDLLDRVGHRASRDHCIGSASEGVQHPVQHLNRDEGAGHVVDQHRVDVSGQRRETERHRRLPGRATGNGRDLVAEDGCGMGHVQSRRYDHDVANAVTGPERDQRMFEQRAATHLRKRFWHRAAEPHAVARGDKNGGDGRETVRRHGNRRAERYATASASTSSSTISALSSLVPSARASSLTRICRAFASMRFSPADKPRSLSRRQRSRTTSATLLTSPDASFSPFALYRRDQLVGSSVCGARSTSKTRSRPSWPTTSRTPTTSALSAGTSTVKSPCATLSRR